MDVLRIQCYLLSKIQGVNLVHKLTSEKETVLYGRHLPPPF